MSNTIPIRAVLMSSEIMNGGSGFHRMVFKVDGGRAGMSSVTVLISQDAHRKLVQQMSRARFQVVEKAALLKMWARWEIALRFNDTGVLPGTVTITARDIDDFGAYASDLGRTLQVGWARGVAGVAVRCVVVLPESAHGQRADVHELVQGCGGCSGVCVRQPDPADHGDGAVSQDLVRRHDFAALVG